MHVDDSGSRLLGFLGCGRRRTQQGFNLCDYRGVASRVSPQLASSGCRVRMQQWDFGRVLAQPDVLDSSPRRALMFK
jgi:hypothetical protein